MRLIDADKADVEYINCFYGGECHIKDVQEWLDEQPTVNSYEWISVKDRLPEDGALVVTYSVPNRRISHCECLKSYVTQYGNYSKVTHWMPLPALPTEKED